MRFTRGFTGHEQIDQVGLVHMNGRVYDPELGRFISADPNVQDLSNSQSLNRYTYVLNNPLSMTDPTGFFFGSILKAIGNFISKVFSAIASAFKAILKIPLIRAAIQIIGCGVSGPPGIALCAAVTGAITMLSGGSIGDALQAMAFTVASAGIWSGVGSFMDTLSHLGTAAFTAVKSVVHGVVGGALSMVQGGSFLDGFAANAVGAAAGIVSEGVFGPAGTGDLGDLAGRVSFAAVAGGSASVLTGGKFANGAITAAFAQMWNAEERSAFRKYLEDGWNNGLARIPGDLQRLYRTFQKDPLLGLQQATDGLAAFPGMAGPSKILRAPIWSAKRNLTSVENAYQHWLKHGKEFPELTNSLHYVKATHDFITNPPAGTLTKIRANGEVLFYNPGSNTFAVQGVNGAPKTMFKPVDKMKYWNDQ